MKPLDQVPDEPWHYLKTQNRAGTLRHVIYTPLLFRTCYSTCKRLFSQVDRAALKKFENVNVFKFFKHDFRK